MTTRRVVRFTEFLKAGGAEKLSVRLTRIATMISEGKSLEEIAVEFDVTRARIQQLSDKIDRIVDHYEEEKESAIRLETLVKSGRPLDEIKLDEVPFTIGTYNCLRNAGCDTLGDVSNKHDAELRRMKKMGDVRVAEVKQILGHFRVHA